jgi:HAD superfamily hydrolase (TIGR01509 family)
MKIALLFDLDGVLFDSKEHHYTALNLALKKINSKYIITKKEQILYYEGLTTKDKLHLLNEQKDLPEEMFDVVWEYKQKYTFELLKNLKKDRELIKVFEFIKDKNIKTGVVSNSIRDTLEYCLIKLGIKDFIDISLSNEDVTNPKPSPEGYLKAINFLKTSTSFTGIFEDSAVGLEAATRSGAFVVPVNSRVDLNLNLVSDTISKLERKI